MTMPVPVPARLNLNRPDFDGGSGRQGAAVGCAPARFRPGPCRPEGCGLVRTGPVQDQAPRVIPPVGARQGQTRGTARPRRFLVMFVVLSVPGRLLPRVMQGWPGVSWVAGMVAQRGGQVDRPGPGAPKTSADEGGQARRHRRPSSGEAAGHRTDRLLAPHPPSRRPWRRHGPGEPGSWLTAALALGATSVMAVEDRAERVRDQVR
jgi:hypothetical protein